MVNERIICCCRASSWTIFIAWIQIVGSALLVILSIAGLAGLSTVDSNTDINNEDTASDTNPTLAVITSLIMAFSGLLMGVILLIGTNQKRVEYLRTWLIYGVVSTIISIIIVILNTSGNSPSSTIGSDVVGGVLGTGINLFTLMVVYTHMKEINEGVYTPLIQ